MKAAGSLQPLVVNGPADRRHVHPDAVGDLLHLERLDRLGAFQQKPRLVIDDRLRGLEQGAAPLLDRIDQPLGGVDLSLDVLAGRGVRVGRHQHVAIERADPQVGQIDLLEPYLPGAVGHLIDIHVRLHRHDDRRREDRPWLRLERVELEAKLLDLLDRTAGLPLDQGKPIGGQVFQMVAHQPPQISGIRHVVPDLQQEALLQISCGHPRRIHVLHHGQRLEQVGLLPGRSVGVDEFLDRHRQVAVDIEVVDHLVGGQPLGLGQLVVRELLVEVVAERLRSFGHVGHDVQIAVARLLDLRCRRPAAVVIAVGILRGPVVGPLEVGLVGVVLVDDQGLLIDRLLGRRRFPVDRQPHKLARRRLLPRLLHLQSLVVLDLLLDSLLERHHGQLQDLHRLDHAGRKHLLLRHPHFLAERHPHDQSLACGQPVVSAAAPLP